MPDGDPDVPQASVVVCTRGRGAKVSATIEAVLAAEHDDFELVVIDQSVDDETEEAVRGFDDPRLRYIRSDEVGTGRSRQMGVREARADLILYTDDDCIPGPEWVTEMVRPFEADARVGVVFCAVTPLVKEKEAGFTPSFEFEEESTVDSVWRYFYRQGMGAGMAVRREAMDEIGGFDINLGPGSKFMSGEDADIGIRALLRDWRVHNTARTVVVHDGLRPWEDYTELARRDWFALGGVLAKPLRCGKPSGYFIAAFQLFYRGIVEPMLVIFRGERPRGFKRFLYLAQGLGAGMRHPLDKEHILYLDAA